MTQKTSKLASTLILGGKFLQLFDDNNNLSFTGLLMWMMILLTSIISLQTLQFPDWSALATIVPIIVNYSHKRHEINRCKIRMADIVSTDVFNKAKEALSLENDKLEQKLKENNNQLKMLQSELKEVADKASKTSLALGFSKHD